MASLINIIDDDEAVRESLKLLLELHGYECRVFSSGDAFLDSDVKSNQSPILLDIKMPGRDGLEVLSIALDINPDLSIVMMSGHADISTAVLALKKGAKDFIEKPFETSEVLRILNRIALQDQEREKSRQQEETVKAKLDKLTPREKEVMGHLVLGKPNKVIAGELGLSVRTVETHRARLLSKLEVKSLSDLVRLSLLSA